VRAYIIGNGTSRKGFNLNILRDKGTIYGCNALYRDFIPDVLIVNDPWMTKEVFEAGYSGNMWCRRAPQGYTHDQVYGKGHPGKTWGAGPTAIWMAAQDYDDLYMLGFDFHGINGLLNNIYANTKSYRSSKARAPDHNTWVKNILTITTDYPKKKFTFVGKNQLTEFINCSNIIVLNYDEFLNDVLLD